MANNQYQCPFCDGGGYQFTRVKNSLALTPTPCLPCGATGRISVSWSEDSKTRQIWQVYDGLGG